MNAIAAVRLWLIAFLLVPALSGCVTRYVDRVVTKTEYVVIAPEAQYFKATPVPAPPPKVNFEPGEMPDFEKLYQDQALTTRQLYQALGQCNADKYSASQDIAKKKKSYD